MKVYSITFNCYAKGTEHRVTRQFTVSAVANSPREAQSFGLLEVKAQYGQNYQNFEYVRCEEARG